MPPAQDMHSDKSQIAELMLRWASSRDQGHWQDLGGTFTSDGEITVSWFRGRHDDFVQASRERHGRTFMRHTILSTLVHARYTRAWAESSVMLTGFGNFFDVPAHWTSYFRFVDRVVRDDSGWRIQRRDAVYDVDMIAPDMPGQSLPLDGERLLQFPRSYRFLGYRLSSQGLHVPTDLPTGGSTREAELRAAAQAWMENVADADNPH